MRVDFEVLAVLACVLVLVAIGGYALAVRMDGWWMPFGVAVVGLGAIGATAWPGGH